MLDCCEQGLGADADVVDVSVAVGELDLVWMLSPSVCPA